MTFDIIDATGCTKTVIANKASLADAIAFARSIFTIVDLEHDPLNQLCVDFYTSTGRVMSIEPRA